MRPQIITAVGDIIKRSDLATRTIHINLAGIPDDERRTDEESSGPSKIHLAPSRRPVQAKRNYSLFSKELGLGRTKGLDYQL